jgi:hypothetical protein
MARSAAAFQPDTAMAMERPMKFREEMINSLLAHASPRPVEWDLAGLLGISRCTNLRELVYGPSPRANLALDAFGSRLRNSARSQDAFEVLRRGFRSSRRVREMGLASFAALVLGRPELTDCLSLSAIAN